MQSFKLGYFVKALYHSPQHLRSLTVAHQQLWSSMAPSDISHIPNQPRFRGYEIHDYLSRVMKLFGTAGG